MGCGRERVGVEKDVRTAENCQHRFDFSRVVIPACGFGTEQGKFGRRGHAMVMNRPYDNCTEYVCAKGLCKERGGGSANQSDGNQAKSKKNKR